MITKETFKQKGPYFGLPCDLEPCIYMNKNRPNQKKTCTLNIDPNSNHTKKCEIIWNLEKNKI